MICTCIQNRDFEGILEILEGKHTEMAEIRLDRCTLSDDEIKELFSETDTPLIATCRIAEICQAEAEHKLCLAIEAGARYADLEIEASVNVSKHIQSVCRRYGTELIRSYHNTEQTPSPDMLLQILERCYRYGADIAKIVTRCNSLEDVDRIEGLYHAVLSSGQKVEPFRLVAFGLGATGKESRIDCLRQGAPFSYAAFSPEDRIDEGQWLAEEMHALIYHGAKRFVKTGLRMPASKSFAQRAIIAAALAEGSSHLQSYTECEDSEAAIRAAEALGAKVKRGSTLEIQGIGPIREKLHLKEINVGESGLLARLLIPILSVINDGPVTITGEGTLPGRPLEGAADIMAAYGVLLRDTHVPVTVAGQLIPGTADVPGKGGSQLISGLLMALPLTDRDSTLYVSEPKSIPYMYITLDVLRKFGIRTESEMEGNAEMLEAQDWSYCTGIKFKVRGGQKLKAADFDIETDWSSAANILVAGAIFGSAEIEGLDPKSVQADLAITDILLEAGAIVSQINDDTICVRRAPLEPFFTDLNNAPDLFPIVSVLAAFCPGESHIKGIGRITSKESNRAEAIREMLSAMGVMNRTDADELIVCGESLTQRLINGNLLNGGQFSSRHDHRMLMALKVASIGTTSPIVIDDEACVKKSFPGFLTILN